VTVSELKTALETSNYPVAYDHFKDAPTVPFVAYMEMFADTLSSDYAVHGEWKTFRVELYTNDKDIEKEDVIKAILAEIDPKYRVDAETYIETERMQQTVFQIKLFERK
jgi:hypothetical protein